MTDLEVEVEQIRQLYLKFEGLTGSQEADAILLLALVLKEALAPLEKIKTTWEQMHKDMKREIDEDQSH